MVDQLEIRGPQGERQLVALPDGDFTLGSGAGADLLVAWPGVDPVHLRFVRTGSGGVRVEPVRPGHTIAVNGEDLFCKDLAHGDVLTLAQASLRWLPAAPSARPPAVASPRRPSPAALPPRSPVSAPVPAASPRPAARRAPARARRSTAANGLAVLSLVALVVAASFVAYRWLRGSTWPSSPQHYVDLARSQLANQRMQEALATLAFALREAEGPTRDEALQLEAAIRSLLVETAEMPKVTVARGEHDLVHEFVARYLRERPERPAARELVRLCDRWLEQHREVCARVGDGRPLLAAIEAERSRWLELADLGAPDTAADVLFAAQSRLRFQWRDYRGAIARLDAFLAGQPGAAEVTAARERMLAEGAEWLQGKLKTIDWLLSRGDRDNAARDLDQLERWSVLPPWAPLVAERRQRLGAGR